MHIKPLDKTMSKDSSNNTDEMSNQSTQNKWSSIKQYRGDDEADGNEDNRVQESELMRTVTQYTDYSVQSGLAVQEEEERKKTGYQPPPKYRFFAKENKQMRASGLKMLIFIVIILMAFILGVWSIYWGSMWQRNERLVNLKTLVVVETDETSLISEALIETTKNPLISQLLGWEVKSYMSSDEIIDLVHTQHYWASIYVSADHISDYLENGFQNAVNVNTTGMIRSYYETGKDMNTMLANVKPTLYMFGEIFQTYLQTISYPSIISNLTDDQFLGLKNTNLLDFPTIHYTDGAPIVNSVTLGPLQIGLIYIIIITFFQYMWMIKLNFIVSKSTASRDYIIYRMVASQIIYLFLSLAFTCLNAAFQIPMNKAWKGGFGVMWMISFLTMSAVGGANENVATIVFPWFPPLVGFWMLFFVMLNISATFSPIELCPGVFKFTYAMPIKNGYELMKVLIFDTYRGHIGREFGILVAWIALNNIILPFTIMFGASIAKNKVLAEQKALEEKAKKDEEVSA